MTWNKRYDQFALSCGLRHSAERLQRWILRRAKQGQVSEIEIDLRVFNQYIARDRGRPYDRKTIKEALRQLDEKTQGLILITKSYTWAIHKVTVRSLVQVLEQNSQIGGKIPKLATGNPMFDGDRKKRARELLLQDISKLDSLFTKLGMKHTPDSLMRIWRLAGKSLCEVKSAVAYMLKVNAQKCRQQLAEGEKPIGLYSAKGWLHDCLKHGRHKVDDYAELPIVEPGANIYTFIDSLMGSSPPG